jgi:HD-like signal output (HDOD) protein
VALAFRDKAFGERLLISAELKKRLENCKALPSPPGVATRIIALANDPDADMDQIAKVLAVDPATTTKILRIANSAMYAMQRKTQPQTPCRGRSSRAKT